MARISLRKRDKAKQKGGVGFTCCYFGDASRTALSSSSHWFKASQVCEALKERSNR